MASKSVCARCDRAVHRRFHVEGEIMAANHGNGGTQACSRSNGGRETIISTRLAPPRCLSAVMDHSIHHTKPQLKLLDSESSHIRVDPDMTLHTHPVCSHRARQTTLSLHRHVSSLNGVLSPATSPQRYTTNKKLPAGFSPQISTLRGYQQTRP